jgi:hypothetical protein
VEKDSGVGDQFAAALIGRGRELKGPATQVRPGARVVRADHSRRLPEGADRLFVPRQRALGEL